MTLGQRIQELRKANNLSQEALGEKLGVSRQAISRWEMDGAVPEVDKLIQLAKLFRISLNDLLQVETGPDETPAPVVLAPAKGWRVWNLVLTVIAAAAVVAAVVLGVRYRALTVRQSTLDVRLSQLNQQLDQLAQQVQRPGLDPTALVGDFRFNVSQSGGTEYLGLELLPGQLPENLTVHFVLKGDGVNATLAASRSTQGSYYTAGYVLPNPYFGPVTVSARLSDGTHEYTQALVRIDQVVDNSCTWEALWEQGG